MLSMCKEELYITGRFCLIDRQRYITLANATLFPYSAHDNLSTTVPPQDSYIIYIRPPNVGEMS